MPKKATYHKKTSGSGRTSRRNDRRKTRQLCAQVAKTLNLALPSINDSILQSLYVAAVDPVPDSSRLLVKVEQLLQDCQYTSQEILAHLQQNAGRLRHEVTISINRRKAPELIFSLIQPSNKQPESDSPSPDPDHG